MKKFLFSVACYLVGLSSLAAFFLLIEFQWNHDPAPFSWGSVARNILVFMAFPLQHSLLARPSVKRRIQEFLHPSMERPFFVGTSGIIMWFILWLWIPTGPYLYQLRVTIPFDIVFRAALLLILYCTLSLDHSAMFGLKQGYAAWKGTEMPASSLQTAGIYGIVRHPITTLLIIALWSHETLTGGRLLFNVLFTSYAILGTIFEERDLMKNYGDPYREYCRRVPPFLPRLSHR